MHPDTKRYNAAQPPIERKICTLLAGQIDRHLPEAENKIWHAHPVWFLEGNPIVGYSRLKDCVRLLFWSGQSFREKGLKKEGSFEAAEVRYTSTDQIDREILGHWLAMARDIQWDYKNLIRRKGRLDRLRGAARCVPPRNTRYHRVSLGHTAPRSGIKVNGRRKRVEGRSRRSARRETAGRLCLVPVRGRRVAMAMPPTPYYLLYPCRR